MDTQLQQDLKLLLSFVPATSPAQVSEGLGGMFYVTGTYKGDVELARKIEDIIVRYDININETIEYEDEHDVY